MNIESAMSVKTKKLTLSYEPLTLTTAHPFGISYGTSSTSSNILVRLHYGELVGFGEASPTRYHDETPETASALFKLWSESDILGDDPFAIEAVLKRLDKSVSGNRSAKAAIDMALHDLVGKLLDRSLVDIFGYRGLPAPITDFTIGIDSAETVGLKTKEALKAGYKKLKVKQGTGYDREIIDTIRALAPDIPIRVDANGAWTVKEAISKAHYLAEQNVEFIEQPLPKYAPLSDWQVLREASPLPIYADESVSTSFDVARLADFVDGVVVKLAKTGGLAEARRVIHTARAHNLKIMFGCMIESSLGITAAAHLAPLVDHLDLDGALLLADDPFEGAVYDDGYLKIDYSLPGLGVIPRKA